MPNAPIVFLEWRYDAAGYDLLPAVPRDPDGPLLSAGWAHTTRVVARGGQAIRYRPLEKEPVMQFAGLHSPEDVLGFIRKWGPLTEAGHDPARGEDVPQVLEHAAAFRSFLSYGEGQERNLASWAGADGKAIGRLDLVLARDPASGMPCLQLRPPTLLGALWLQLGQKLSGNRPFRECLHCKAWFETGPGAGRRLDAMFCSDEHRQFFNSLKRSKGRRAHV
jgi:hypothetical protein